MDQAQPCLIKIVPVMSNAPLSDELRAQAAEYVLGTLDADERRAIELQLGSNAALRAAIVQWEADLLPLASLAEPVTPSAQLWRRIQRHQAQLTAHAGLHDIARRLVVRRHQHHHVLRFAHLRTPRQHHGQHGRHGNRRARQCTPYIERAPCRHPHRLHARRAAADAAP